MMSTKNLSIDNSPSFFSSCCGLSLISSLSKFAFGLLLLDGRETVLLTGVLVSHIKKSVRKDK